jgi:hypothetical protein
VLLFVVDGRLLPMNVIMVAVLVAFLCSWIQINCSSMKVVEMNVYYQADFDYSSCSLMFSMLPSAMSSFSVVETTSSLEVVGRLTWLSE